MHRSHFNINQWWRNLPEGAFSYPCQGGLFCSHSLQRSHTSQAGQYKISVKTQTTDLKQALNNVKHACELPFGLDLMAQIIIFRKRSWYKTTSRFLHFLTAECGLKTLDAEEITQSGSFWSYNKTNRTLFDSYYLKICFFTARICLWLWEQYQSSLY